MSKAAEWENYYLDLKSLMFPNEYVTRVFMGRYPNLNLDKNYAGKRIADISCGDGRNLMLLSRLGFDLHGTEITDGICSKTLSNLASAGITADIRQGTNENLPFQEDDLDYLLSWNAAYYLASETSSIGAHVQEYARILKPGGLLICSVPSPGCYSLQGATHLGDDVLMLNPALNSWGGGLMKGSLFYGFRDRTHIEAVWGTCFDDFRFGTLRDDCFGMPLEYFLFVGRKKQELS